MRWKKRKKTREKQHISNPCTTYSIGCAQHIGARETQEDSFDFLDIQDARLIEEIGIIVVIADGMGGLSYGKDASEAAVHTFKEVYENKAISENVSSALNRAVKAANRSVHELSNGHHASENMGTTLVAAVVYDGRLFFISVGDSRIYLYRNAALEVLNIPHNYANTLRNKVIVGELTQDQANDNPEKEYLTSYLGLESIAEIDYNQVPIRLQEDDMVVLCSDGLFNTLSDTEICQALDNNKTAPQAAAEELIIHTLNKNNGYQDNVTIAVIAHSGNGRD